MPVVRVSEQLFKEIQKYAEPLVDNFETTLWKILKLVGKDNVQIPIRRETRPVGNLTPPKDFWKPILETLVNEGGQASVQNVIQSVERKMGNRLKPGDHEKNFDGSEKWEKQVNYQRLAMKHEGLLANNSPRGIWAITDQGRKWLSEQSSVQDEIQRKIRELEKELTEIDLQDKTLGDWNTKREEQLQKEIESLRLELDKLSTNQD